MITASQSKAAGELRTIVPQATTDVEDLRQLFKGGKLIPYAGTNAKSNHSYAQLLIDLVQLSPSRGSCHRDIIDYCFENGSLEVRYRNRSGFKMRSGREVEPSLAESYIDALLEVGFSGTKLTKLSKDIEREKLATGFAAAIVSYARVGDQRRCEIEVKGIQHVVLRLDENSEMTAVYFPAGIKNLSESKEFYIYPVYDTIEQALQDLERETEASFVMISRNGQGPYGRPGDLQAVRAMVTEAAYQIHDEKVSTSVTTAKAIVSYPVPADQEDQPIGDEDASLTAQQESEEAIRNARAALDKNDIGFLPFEGDVPPSLISLSIARDAKHRAVIDQICQTKIYSANRWSTDLTGATSPDGGIGSGYLRDLIAFKNATVIRGIQSASAAFVNDLLRIVITDERFQDITHAFPDPLTRFEFPDQITTDDGMEN